MSHSLARRLALLNCCVILALVLPTFVLEALFIAEGEGLTGGGLSVIGAPVVIAMSVLGYRIIVRRPENVIGPGFSLWALLATFSGLVEAYLHYALDVSSRSLPVEFAVWASEWLWIPLFLPLLTFLFLLCPDGRLPSPRWRPVAYAIAAHLTIMTLGTMLSPYESRPEFENPYTIEALGSLPKIGVWAGYIGFIPAFGLSALAMILRFQRSSGIERQQLKWFTSASIAVFGLFLLTWIASSFTESETLWGFWLGGSVAAVMGAAAIAVLRYRLYDIDRILNRTLVYAVLTAGLGALYFGSVIGLQELLHPLSGGSDLAIVLTTLAGAALFLPARQLVQTTVDRRFNRRTYDAARTIDAFSARLREQLELDTLAGEIRDVLIETMEPSRISVQLRVRNEFRTP